MGRELDLIWDTIEEDLINKLVSLGLPDPYPLEEISKGLERVEEAVKNSANPPSPLTKESFQQYVDQLGGKHSIKPYSPIIPTHLYNMIKSGGKQL